MYPDGREREAWKATRVAVCLILGLSVLNSGLLRPYVVAGAGPELLSIRLVPKEVTLWGPKASQRFLVLARYTDGLERDVTPQSRLSLSNQEVAAIKQPARVVAKADGKVLLAAEFRGQVAKTGIRIEGVEEARPFSFQRDIGGIFVRLGCSSSDCHGGVKGKGGFKLSLNALHPRDDYKWTVEGGTYQVLAAEAGGEKNPRIDLQEPEKSLLLLKATFEVPHGGGQRFTVDSEEYRTVLDWIGRGAPFGEQAEDEIAQLERVEVFPKEAVLDKTGSHQLLVTAHLTNGRREDITDRVLYVSNNLQVVEVSPEGLVKVVGTGETAVMIRAAGHATSASFGVIADPVSNYPDLPPARNFIDEHVFAKLRKFNIIPSNLCSDEEFLRRVCLDVTGTLPPPPRVREFLANKDPQKRERLIEALLDSPEYVDFWTFRFADFFRVMWTKRPYRTWLRNSIAQNKPYDQMARERVAAEGNAGPGGHYFKRTGELLLPHQKMTEDVRVFLGRRLDCAQCHDHPFETWSQNQFWGMAAFFGRLSRIREGNLVLDDPAGHGERREGPQVIHPRSKQEVEPRFLDGTLLPESERDDPRWKLAEWMTSPRNPYFATVIVNRMWSYFLGRGLVNPVDDFRSTNPATHPDLLEALARDFVDHGYDLKHFIRLILQSRTYELSGTPNETNKEDRINYSRNWPRRLDAEVLLDAISRVSGVDEDFVIHHFVGGGVEPPGTRAIHVPAEITPSHFLNVFGRPGLRETMPVRNLEPNLGQALHMLVGSTYSDKISREGGRLDGLLKKGASDREIVEEFYLAALSRFPTKQEVAGLEKAIGQSSSRRKAMKALVWGLIASREFAYNH